MVSQAPARRGLDRFLHDLHEAGDTGNVRLLADRIARHAPADEVDLVCALLKAMAMAQRGCVLALIGKADDAVQTISVAITAYRSTGATVWITSFLSYLALAYADLGKFDDAKRCIGQATTVIDTAKERWFEAEVHRIAGEIALRSPEPDAAKAKAYFQRALVVARQQQAKSWELRAAMSLTRLWRDQGKLQQASSFPVQSSRTSPLIM